MTDSALVDAAAAVAQRCQELRVPESLLKETLRQAPLTALQYIERLSLSRQHYETVATVICTHGPSMLVRQLPVWRVFSVQDDVFLARRFLKSRRPKTAARKASPVEGTLEDINTALQPLNTFTDAEKERLSYLFSAPAMKGKFDVTLPATVPNIEDLVELTYGRIPLEEALKLDKTAAE